MARERVARHFVERYENKTLMRARKFARIAEEIERHVEGVLID